LPPTHLMRQETRHLVRFARNGSNQRSLTLDISYLSSLGFSKLSLKFLDFWYARTGVPYLFL